MFLIFRILLYTERNDLLKITMIHSNVGTDLQYKKNYCFIVKIPMYIAIFTMHIVNFTMYI